MTAHTITSTTTVESPLLRFALKADAVVTGANAAVYMAAAPLLDSWLGVPTGVLLAIGAFLAVYAGLVYRLATRAAMPRGAVAAVIATNVVWAVDSLIALGLDWFTPTVAGQVIIAVQAAGVLAFAALQYAGLRRAG
jgi:hypothetical protein